MYAFNDGTQWVKFTDQKLPLADYEPTIDPETNEPIAGQVNLFTVPSAWSDAEKLERFGLHVVTIDQIPDGKRIVSEMLVDDGGSPRLLRALADAPVAVPDRVSARQFKLQLLADGLIDQVGDWVATQSSAVQIAYEYSGSFAVEEPMMQAGFTALGFTEAQRDAFFIAAAAL